MQLRHLIFIINTISYFILTLNMRNIIKNFIKIVEKI